MEKSADWAGVVCMCVWVSVRVSVCVCMQADQILCSANDQENYSLLLNFKNNVNT